MGDALGEQTYSVRRTALGWVGVVGSARGLARLLLPRAEAHLVLEEIVWRHGPIPADDGLYDPLFAKLERYFAGERVEFDEPIAPSGTPFQLAVWHAVHGIPYGETRSYGDIARAVGRPQGPRAVGQAVGSNPLGIVVPCHRVVSSDGTIGGFGGSLELKRALLKLEGVTFPE